MASKYRWLSLSVLAFPPLLLVYYFVTAFPNAPEPMQIHHSLATLPKDHPVWNVYPEDFYNGGGYASLPNGKTRYYLLGPEDGPKLILIHGLSIPTIVWKDIAPQLAARGFRVLLYDLYGRGYSDAPQTTYDVNLYTMQLALLMQYLHWDKAHVAGMSMGGAISAAFVAQFPHLVDDRIAFIASAGLIGDNDISRTSRLVSAPVVQSVVSSGLVRNFVQSLLATPVKHDEGQPNPVEEIVRIQSTALPGFNHAVSSSLRDGPIRGQSSAFSSKSFKHRKVLLIHGTADRTVDYKYAGMIQELLPPETPSELVTIEGARHHLLTSHAHVVVPALDYFFKDGKVGTVSEAAYPGQT